MLYARLARCAVSASLLAGSVVAISIVAAPSASASTAASVPGSFQDLRPARFLDTRTGLGAAKAPVRGGHSVGIRIAGLGLVPASGVSAVALTVTATAATGSGYLTVFGHGTPRPDTSDVHYAPGLPESNLVIARVGSGGMVDVYVGGTGTVQLAADVSGYYLSGTPSLAGTFAPLAPQRFLSTREGIGAPKAAVAAGRTLAVQVAGRGHVPATGVAAVAIEMTATGPTRTGSGDITVYAHGTARPATSDLHYAHDQAAQNLVVAKLGADGGVDVSVAGTGSAQLIGDVSGYFLSGAANRAGTFVALAPQRFLNTHIGAGAPRAAVAAGHVLTLQITGRGQVPLGNVGVVALSVTAFSSTAAGGITAFRHGVTRPGTSDLQYVRGQTVTNLVFAELSADGKVDLRVAGSGTVQLAADVSGYYLSAPTPASVTASKSEPIPGAGLIVTAGQPAPITYQVSVANSGGTDSAAVTVTDAVPAGTTYVPGSASCGATPNCSLSVAPGLITWSLTSLGAGDTRDLSFQASVDAADTDGSTLSNSASFTNVNTPGCATPVCATNTVTNPVITRASVTVTKSETPPAGTVTAGQLAPVTYQLAIANSGGTASDPVTVTDTVPAGTTYLSGSATCGTTPNCAVNVAAGTVTWTVSSATPNSTNNLSFQVTVDATAANGSTVTNNATFTNINTPGCGTPTCPTNTVTNPVITPASISVVKSATPAAGTTVTAGQLAPIGYQLAVTNSGGTAATTVTVTDAIPVGTTYVPASASCGTTPDCSVVFALGTITWTLTSVAPLSAENLGFQVTVDAADADASTVTNTAFFTNVNTSGCVTPTCPTNAVSHPVTTQPGITVVKSANPASGSTVTAGQAAPITYQLAVANSGGTASGPVTVTDTVPAGTTYVAASATCGAAPDCSTSVTGDVITWTFTTVAGLSTANVTFDVSVDAADTTGSVISNDATFSNVNTAGCATPTCPTNTVTHNVVTAASIDVAKSETPSAGIVTAGQAAPITYQLAVQNSGGTASTAVTVTDTVPAGTSYVSGSATCGTAPTCTVDVAGGTVTWTLPVAPLSTENLSFQVTVDASDANGSTISNNADFTNLNTPGCGTPICATNTVTNPVVTEASISVDKSASPAADSTVTAGQAAPITYGLALHNTGGTPSDPMTVTDPIPAGTTYVAGSATCGSTPTCTVDDTGTITWTIGSIAPTSTENLTFQVTVDAADANGSTIANTASFTNINTPACVTPTCDTNTVSHPVVTRASVMVVKSEPTPGAGVTVTSGQPTPISYQLDATNSGGTAAGPMTVTDPIPAGTTYVAGSVACPVAPECTGTATASEVTWTFTSVAALTTYALTFQVTVNAADLSGATIDNIATFTNVNTPGCGTPTCPTNTVSNPVITPASVTVVKSEPSPGAGSTVVPGQSAPLTYRFTVHNSGATDFAGPFFINDAVPVGTTYVLGSATCPAGLNAGTTPSCTVTVGPTIVWAFSSIPALTSYSAFGFDVTVDAAAASGSTITNTAAFSNAGTPLCVAPFCNTNTITNPVDAPPVAVNDVATVGEDSGTTAIPVLANDTDVDGGPKTVASVTQPANGTVVITGGGTGLTYAPNANYCNSPPSTTPDTFTYTLNGGSTATVSITVTCVDDPPVAVNDAATVNEDSGAVAVNVLANDTDIDGGPKSIASISPPANGAVVITGGGTGLTYQPNVNYCGADTFTYTLNGGSIATVSITVTCVNDPPTAVDDTFNAASSAVGNTALVVNAPGDGPQSVAGPKKSLNANILANDTDVDGPNALTIQAGTLASNDGGIVVIESDGDFTFTPAAGTSCSDTSDFFDYTITDGNTPTAGTDTGRVTIAITGCVWYVNNNAAGNAGTSTAPFDTLAQAQTASGAGDTIFLEDGDDTTTGYNAGFDLKTNQRLLGEAATLQIGSDVLQTAIPANRPTITDNNADVVKLASGSTVRGVQLDPQGAGGGIAGGDGTAPGSIASATIDDVRIIDTGTAGTQPGLELNQTSGTFNVSDLVVNNSAATGSTSGSIGVRLNNAGTVNFNATGTISITTAGAKGLDATGTNLGAGSVFDDITVTGSATGAVSMVSTTGTTALGDGSGGDLALTTTSGANPALNIVNAGPTTIPTAGTSNVSATGGPAVNVTGTTGSILVLDNVSSTNSASQGINLVGLDTTTFSAPSGTLAGFAGTAFVVNGGSGNIIYLGNVNDGPGNTADITNRTAGQVLLSGTITDGNDAGGGISLAGNTGGVVSMNGNKTLSTGASDAFNAAFPDGSTATVLLTGGGIHITTTTGKGLTATGVGPTPDGSVLVTSSGASTIDSSSGTALSLSNVAISSGDMTFQRISAGNNTAAADPADGIVLNNTGVNARLVIASSGSGTCTVADTSGCTGGEIQHLVGGDDSGTTPVGTGIVLNNTLNPSFTRMWIHDASNYGIRGTSVAGFTLASSVINGTNGTTGTTPFDDSSAWFDNLTGSASVTNSAVSGGYEDNFRVVNTSGSLNRITFTSDTIGDNSAAGGNDGLLLETATTAGQLQATIESSTFTGAGGDLLQYDHNGSGTGDLILTGNAFSNNHPGIATGGGGLTLTNGGTSGATTMTITGGNTFRDAVGNALTIAKSTGPSTQTGTFSGNTIGVNALVNSGSAEGDALKIQSLGQGSLNWSVTNNTIRGYNNFGVEVEAGGSATAQSGAINATITGNTIDQPGNTAGTLGLPKNGVHLNIGTVPGDTYQACAVIGGAGTLANSLASAGADAVPSVGGGQDVRLRQRQSATIRLPGYAGAPTDVNAVQAFVAANNPSGGPAVIASVNAPPGGGFTGAGSTCP